MARLKTHYLIFSHHVCML